MLDLTRRERNQFLDLEAVAGDDDDTEEEGLYDEEFLLEDRGHDFTGKAHPAVFNGLRRAEEEEGEITGRWQELVDRAHARTNSQRYHRTEQDSDDEGYVLQDDDILWEIGCKVGSEQAVVFEILASALHYPNAGELATSVVASTTPGRIYAEVRSSAQVFKLARSFAVLNPYKVSPVPREDVFKILKCSPSHKYWPWARTGNPGLPKP
ncbi:hypothetical protein HYPSUDRAFT_210324 [Hypholoma sublateritium FD-334 SS-4]|uniref:Uncharacterized protein n=1 Tax=Hypholoma sublateritium (strain FD-334 SS-4) TaxID=945553 RepID=A0A0D2KDH0_HYPSF|nr:hypothetical protein HYPSUDRAFT_210324 [Hypholoma sublateritium FD-334 SS-4]